MTCHDGVSVDRTKLEIKEVQSIYFATFQVEGNKGDRFYHGTRDSKGDSSSVA